MHLREQRVDVHFAVRRRERREPALCLLELALAAPPVAAARLIPGDGDVDEALEEVALPLVGRAPRRLQLFMGSEVLAAPDQLQPCGKLRRCRARSLRAGG
jgi:hypothetical protein